MRFGSRKTVALCLAALVAIALGAPGPSTAPAASGASRHHPLKPRGTYWGAWIGPQLTGAQPPWDMSAVSQFEGLAGKGLSLIQFAAPFANCDDTGCTPYRFPAHEMETIRNYGAIPVFSWGSQSVPVPDNLEEPEFQLAKIAAGAYDPYLREFAEAARNWGHPFFLRFDWEMNGNWFPWSEGVNGNPPGSYVAAWRHVHDVFASVGATDVNWAWCPYADPTGRLASMRRFYPGKAYVDWTCLDGYNWAKNGVNSQPWRSFGQIFESSYAELIHRIAPGKPVMLGEMASGGGDRAKATWIRKMFKELRTKYRRIRALMWFDQIDRGVQWPIESLPRVIRAFEGGLHQSGYKGNHFQAIPEGPIRPPG